jgi:hypothetical protein
VAIPFGIPLRKFLFGREGIPGAEEASPTALPPPTQQGPDPSSFDYIPPDQQVALPPVDPGAIEGGEAPVQAGPPLPPTAAPPIISPAARAPLRTQQGLTPPTYEPLPTMQGPKGLKQILMYGIPGYAQGRQARYESDKDAVQQANLLKAKTYDQQLAAQRESRMEEMGYGNLQQRMENFQETVRNHLEREEIARQTNDLRKNAEFNKLMGRGKAAAIVYAGRSDLSEGEKHAGIRKSFGLATTDELNYETLLRLADGDPALIASLPKEVLRMFGALPPAPALGAQPSTTTHYGGVDYLYDEASGQYFQVAKPPSVSVRTPGIGGPPPSAAPQSAPVGTGTGLTPVTGPSGQPLIPSNRVPQVKNQTLKIYQPAVEADTRLSVMQKDAADVSGQSDVSLLFNHIGMTLGAQKGARITNAEIERAITARSVPQGLLAQWDAVSKGQFLSPQQRMEMVKLAVQMRREMWLRARAQAAQLGITREPEPHPDLPPVVGGGPSNPTAPAKAPAPEELMERLRKRYGLK